MLFELDRDVTFMGIDYKVVQVLENGLLLVVNKKESENENYPLQTWVIPE